MLDFVEGEMFILLVLLVSCLIVLVAIASWLKFLKIQTSFISVFEQEKNLQNIVDDEITT